MKQDLNLYFTIGYLSGLENHILNERQIEELKKAKTIEQFSSKLKSYKFKIFEFKDYEDFEEKIDDYLTSKMEEIKILYPVPKNLDYIFCKNNFLNFKIDFISKFSNSKIQNLYLKPNTLEPSEIRKSLENEDFQYIKSPFKESFQKILNNYKSFQNIQQTEILIDQQTYYTLLNLAKKDVLLTKRTKIEISLKNIIFCIRFLRHNSNLKELELLLIDEGVILIKDILNAANKGINSLLNLFNNFDIQNINLDKNQDLNKIETISEKILNNFDMKYFFNPFSFIKILIYISKLEKENKILKETLLKIYYKI